MLPPGERLEAPDWHHKQMGVDDGCFWGRLLCVCNDLMFEIRKGLKNKRHPRLEMEVSRDEITQGLIFIAHLKSKEKWVFL